MWVLSAISSPVFDFVIVADTVDANAAAAITSSVVAAAVAVAVVGGMATFIDAFSAVAL